MPLTRITTLHWGPHHQKYRYQGQLTYPYFESALSESVRMVNHVMGSPGNGTSTILIQGRTPYLYFKSTDTGTRVYALEVQELLSEERFKSLTLCHLIDPFRMQVRRLWVR